MIQKIKYDKKRDERILSYIVAIVRDSTCKRERERKFKKNIKLRACAAEGSKTMSFSSTQSSILRLNYTHNIGDYNKLYGIYLNI